MTQTSLTHNENVLTFRVPNFCAEFHQNQTKIATVGAWTDRQTDTRTNRRTLVIYNLLNRPCEIWQRPLHRAV